MPLRWAKAGIITEEDYNNLTGWVDQGMKDIGAMSVDAKDVVKPKYYNVPWGANLFSAVCGLGMGAYWLYYAIAYLQGTGFSGVGVLLGGMLLLIHSLILGCITANQLFDKVPHVTGIRKKLTKQEKLQKQMLDTVAIKKDIEQALSGLPEDSAHYTNFKSRQNELEAYMKELEVEMVYGRLSELDKKASKVMK